MRADARARNAAKIGVLLAAALSAATAWAAPHDWPPEPFSWPGWPLAPPHERRAEPPVRMEPPTRGPYGRDYHPRYGRWAPGQILPPDAPATMVDNPEIFHLRRAPRGYVWLICAGDFILASATTGMIYEVIPGGPGY